MYAWDAVWSNVTDERYCSTSWFHYAYDHTSAGSALRNLAVDQSAYYVDAYDMKPCRQVFPHEMLFDLVLVYNKAVLHILPGDKVNQDLVPHEEFSKQPLMDFERYSCTRTYRSYLVPEN
jgi:hypothetical protein